MCGGFKDCPSSAELPKTKKTRQFNLNMRSSSKDCYNSTWMSSDWIVYSKSNRLFVHGGIHRGSRLNRKPYVPPYSYLILINPTKNVIEKGFLSSDLFAG